MFGKKTDSNPSAPSTRSSHSSSSQHNSLVVGTRVEGNITSENDFRVDGTFLGNLTCSARVIIGSSGRFEGEIVCQNAIIEGNFSGKLDIHDVLEVREGAVIEGDVTTGKLQVQAGSVFDVKCVMGDRSSSQGAESKSSDYEALVTENGKEALEI